ncbi:hypothetical protein [Sphingomonas parva]|uniref:hypothetical protein n=1 Tax=Sphingomonas parva TaxID=2555898 RepID=UPI001430E64D|nr:hypothetical protein [Sphingomonas parva]
MTGRLAGLSLAGLRLAAAGLPAPSETLARRLYRFGTYPRGPAIERDFGLDDEPMSVLGLARGGSARRCLEAAFEATSFPGWFSFARGDAPRVVATCKLYVSPLPQALPGAFPVVAEAFAGGGVRSFKVGRGLEGLLRPDKIVAYFDDPGHLREVARTLGALLSGCPAQGTPFTADLGGDGLLSWGADPAGGEGGVSWRSWITRRLAAGLTQAGPADPVSAALRDIAQAGVDPVRWAPAGGSLQ